MFFAFGPTDISSQCSTIREWNFASSAPKRYKKAEGIYDFRLLLGGQLAKGFKKPTWHAMDPDAKYNG